jgi:hypothetical protein
MMRFRLIFRTAAALLAIAVLVPASHAAEQNRKKAVRRAPVRLYYGGHPFNGNYRYGGYYGQIGGYRYGPVPERNEFLHGSAYNYPGYYNNQFFWERVQTQRNFPVQY